MKVLTYMYFFLIYKYLTMVFVENKTKKRWDGIQTMAEAKLALKKLFEIIGESKKKETVKQSQFYDLTSENAEVSNRSLVSGIIYKYILFVAEETIRRKRNIYS